jgi:hypothetical protein
MWNPGHSSEALIMLKKHSLDLWDGNLKYKAVNTPVQYALPLDLQSSPRKAPQDFSHV